LQHPSGGRDLIVLGHYERTSGGCDTIPLDDGGLDEVFRLAEVWSGAGHDVFLEGLNLSSERERSVGLAGRHHLRIILLTISPQ
jgi:hypothetical protein